VASPALRAFPLGFYKKKWKIPRETPREKDYMQK